MSTVDRPLSPHLQVYRLPLAAILSILHRATGVFLSLGSLLLVWWLMSVAHGEAGFNNANAVVGSIIGQLILFGFTFALFFHLSNGIRHLFWDAGLGFELPAVARSSVVVILSAAILTISVWALAYL
ncbi:MAG: succinate dehydrogenase, cytochrome b556 subunit [Gammaproteobacteria bacterium]|nr:MAG: succinate dehydrogenase, cytochrome b556 subunit [Gammaproteobacteria bacterium]